MLTVIVHDSNSYDTSSISNSSGTPEYAVKNGGLCEGHVNGLLLADTQQGNDSKLAGWLPSSSFILFYSWP